MQHSDDCLGYLDTLKQWHQAARGPTGQVWFVDLLTLTALKSF